MVVISKRGSGLKPCALFRLAATSSAIGAAVQAAALAHVSPARPCTTGVNGGGASAGSAHAYLLA